MSFRVKGIRSVLPVGRLTLALALSGFVAPTDAVASGPSYPVPVSMPLSFEANRGQTHESVRFLSRGPGYALFLTPTEAVLSLTPPAAADGVQKPPSRGPSGVLRVKLVDGNPDPEVTGVEEMRTRSHYLRGQNPEKWTTGVPHYRKVRYAEVYPGIDLVYRGNPRTLEYDFLVAAEADPSVIRLDLDGAVALRIDTQGSLIARLPGGEVTMRAPVVYQEAEGARREVTGRWVLEGERRARLALGTYDRSQPLVIDPEILFSTRVGGGNDHNPPVLYGPFVEEAFDVALDSNGAVYVVGWTSKPSFPATPGAVDSFCCATWEDTITLQTHTKTEGFVAKIDTSVPEIVWATFLGTSSNFPDWYLAARVNAVAVDDGGRAYVTGYTGGFFPTTPDAYRPSGPGRDGFLAVLAPDGASLEYATTFGGLGPGNDVAIDAAGDAYVAGSWQGSLLGQDFGGPGVAKFDLDSTPVYATRLSSRGHLFGDGNAFALAVDATGGVFVGGLMRWPSLITTAGAYDATCGSDGLCDPNGPFYPENRTDGFAARLDASGGIVWSTYLGGAEPDSVHGVAISHAGDPVFVGATRSPDFPIVDSFQLFNAGEAPSEACGLGHPCNDAFVTTFTPDGASPVLSTFLGGTRDDSALDVFADGTDFWTCVGLECQFNPSARHRIYVVGATESWSGFPLVDPFQTDCADGVGSVCNDGFVARIDYRWYPNFPCCGGVYDYVTWYSSYLGSGGQPTFSSERANGVAADMTEKAYVVGSTGPGSFPLVNPLASAGDAFLTKIGESVCGDGVREGSEECDDGNRIDGDCCSSTCFLEPFGTACEDGDVCTQGDTCDAEGLCIGGPQADTDTDGVCDPEDNCPFESNPGQEDVGGIGSDPVPDGEGDVCQCGDVTDNGKVEINDATIIKRALLGLGPGMQSPLKCNVIGLTTPGDRNADGIPDDCQINDSTVVKRAILGLGPGIEPVCEPAVP